MIKHYAKFIFYSLQTPRDAFNSFLYELYFLKHFNVLNK